MGVSCLSVSAEETVKEWNGWRYRTIFDGERVEICGYVGEETELTVPAEIDGLPVWSMVGKSNGGLWKNDTITKVVFPDSVRVIRFAFQDCTALEEVELPANVYAIYNSFEDCPKLTEVFLPDSLMVCEFSFYTAIESEKTVDFVRPLLKMHEPTRQRLFTPEEDFVEIIPYPYTVGDVNADNAINTTDARLVLQASVGKHTFTEEQQAVADVDGDGKADTTDARRCLQYAVGKECGFTDQLLHVEPLFTIDLDTAVVTVKKHLDASGATYVVEDGRIFAEAAQQAQESGPVYGDQILMPATYSLTITWGEGTIAETVGIGIKTGGGEWYYGGEAFRGGLPSLSWWEEQLNARVEWNTP